MDRRSLLPSQNPAASGSRRHQFPLCVTDVLEQVNKFCSQQGVKWRSGAALRNSELQYQIDGDLFCLSADRRTSRLNPIQQHHLLKILCDYFNERESEPKGYQYLYFETIFCGREGESVLHETRISWLIELSSLAVQYPCYILLNHISQWLHKIGSGKSYAQQFISHLVDHYIMSPPNLNLHKNLLPLAEETPEFVSYFIAYSISKDTLNPCLVEVISEWLISRKASRILAFIKENPVVSRHFATNVFSELIAYDCLTKHSNKSPLHGFITMLYAEWDHKTSPLLVVPGFQAIFNRCSTEDFNKEMIRYHAHLSKQAKLLDGKDLNDFVAQLQ